MEATVKDWPAVHELASQRIGARIVQSYALANQKQRQMLTFESFVSIMNRITEKRSKKKTQVAAEERRGEGVPCPMRTRAGDRCGWRIGGWIFRRTAGS